jgi:enoyl-CoA hydratase/carnithine racemase
MQFCEIERQGTVLIVTFNRPERLNALHSDAHFELSRIFDEFEVDRSLRVAVVTGCGDRAFCAGNDLKFQAAGGSLERPKTGFGGLANRLDRTKPVIAAVNGIAAGGGCEIVLACDIAVAAENAVFSFPEVKRGLVPLTGIHLLIRTIHAKDATAMLISGRGVSAREAREIGLVNEVVPQGGALAGALIWAHTISECSPSAVMTTLDLVRRSAAATLAEAFAASYDSLTAHRAGRDFVEGPRAFAERRPPRWDD